MSAANAAETATLDAWFGSTVLGPANWLVAAYTVAPTDAGGGTECAAAGGYARVSVPNNPTNFPAASSGAPSSKQNGQPINFPISSAAWMAGAAIVALGFHTAAGDNLRFWFPIAAGDQQAITTDSQQLSFPAGTVTVTMD
jgi:hypothetical protein